ncbi:hypothetical protein Xen7305DRAFT_00041890 [Xenococcus sp. PCC 7305]|nr:hypothetical protein Xen7305DRAFT_00041890 [Xenococcus sp. PCC 7305]
MIFSLEVPLFEIKPMNVYKKLNKMIAENQSLLVVELDPKPKSLPSLENRSIAKRGQLIDDLYQFRKYPRHIRPVKLNPAQ